MRRADRLLGLMEVLRRKPLITGAELARALEVSLRTVYRDIQALTSIGVPIRGEAGVGYSLEPGYYLPPLNLTPEEAEVLSYGAQLLKAVGDETLSEKLTSAIAKIRAVLSRDAQGAMDRDLFSLSEPTGRTPARPDLLNLRRAAESRRVLEIEYAAADGTRAVEAVQPLSLSVAGTWYILGLREEDGAFRRFQLDRVHRIVPTGRVFRPERGQRLADFLQRAEPPSEPT